MRQAALFVISLTLCWIVAPGIVPAADGCCDSCGCHGQCHKVCRLVPEEKKIEVTCWGSKCEDFCIGGPSQRGCVHCDIACAECAEPKGVQSTAKHVVWRDWLPNCTAKTYSKKKLLKKIVNKKVPSYKWVVEDLCAECKESAAVALVEPEANVPPPPVVTGATVIDGIRVSGPAARRSAD